MKQAKELVNNLMKCWIFQGNASGMLGQVASRFTASERQMRRCQIFSFFLIFQILLDFPEEFFLRRRRISYFNHLIDKITPIFILKCFMMIEIWYNVANWEYIGKLGIIDT